MSSLNNKPIKRLILPTENNYKTAKRLELLVLALRDHKDDIRLKSQAGIADIMREIAGTEKSYNQCNIAKIIKEFNAHTVMIKEKVVEIEKNGNGYYVLTEVGSKEYQQLQIEKMRKSKLFLNEKIFYNALIGTATMFIFNVDEAHSNLAKNALYEVIDPDDIFDIMWRDNKLTLLLDPTSDRCAKNSELLKEFFKEPESKD